jgi:hypothetical protein
VGCPGPQPELHSAAPASTTTRGAAFLAEWRRPTHRRVQHGTALALEAEGIVEKISLMPNQHAPCPDCDGTGWICLTCERTGRRCTCSLDAQDAIDCQSCQGKGTDDMEAESLCDWCTRPTTQRPHHSRTTYRHKCPHGHWCPRSDKFMAHEDHYPMNGPCDECRRAYWQRDHVLRDPTLSEAIAKRER